MTSYPINDAGIRLLHERESFVPTAYPDPYSKLGKALRAAGKWRAYLRSPFPLGGEFAGLSGHPWTIGYGFTKGVKEGDRMTRAQADQRLAQELREYTDGVLVACTVEPNENELAAMVVLAWNIGIGGFLRSTVLKCHNRGDKPAAARAFRLWNKAGGEVSPGLESRRAAEAALYLTPVGAVEPEAMPQAVEPERPMVQSSINRGAAVAGGTAAVATVAETARTVADVKQSVASLGDWLVPILLVISVAAIGYIVWERLRQRRDGWT